MLTRPLSLLIFLASFSLSFPIQAKADQTTLDILNDVNAYRHQHGLPPLSLRQDLCAQAQKHSVDMATHHIPFGHAGFGGRVKYAYSHTKQPNGAAENVAYNYKDGHDVVKNWLTSRHHLANIRGHYNYTGIGIARDSRSKLYFTQFFLQVG